MCGGGGAENGSMGATVRREGYSLTATIFVSCTIKHWSYDLNILSVVMKRCGAR